MVQQDYLKLNPRCKTAQRIKYGLIALFLLAFAAITFVSRDPELGAAPHMIFGVLFAAMAIVTLVFPPIYYNHYRYIITSDKVDVRKGVIFLRHTVVPIERLHQVKVVSGPVSRVLGLAHVEVTTAGGKACIEYLEKDVADNIAEELNKTVDAILKARKNQ